MEQENGNDIFGNEEANDIFEELRKLQIFKCFDDLRGNGTYVPNIFSHDDDIEKLERFHKYYINDDMTALNINDIVILMMYKCVRETEMIASKFNILGKNLNGFADEFETKYNNFKPIIDKVIDRYITPSDDDNNIISPEMKLLFMLGESAMQFHLGCKKNNEPVESKK
jgi:hypothetical protein